MASSRKRHAIELFRGLPDHYDRVGAVMSFGQDPRWRQALVDAIDPRPLDQSKAMPAGAEARLQRRPDLRDRLSFMLGEAEADPHPDWAAVARSRGVP